MRLASVLTILFLSASGAAAVEPAVKCQADKLKQAGNYSKCRFGALSKAAKKSDPADYSKCDSTVEKKWLKVEAKGGCVATGDLGTIKQIIVSDTNQQAAAIAAPLCPCAGDFLTAESLYVGGNGSPDDQVACDFATFQAFYGQSTDGDFSGLAGTFFAWLLDNGECLAVVASEGATLFQNWTTSLTAEQAQACEDFIRIRCVDQLPEPTPAPSPSPTPVPTAARGCCDFDPSHSNYYGSCFPLDEVTCTSDPIFFDASVPGGQYGIWHEDSYCGAGGECVSGTPGSSTPGSYCCQLDTPDPVYGHGCLTSIDPCEIGGGYSPWFDSACDPASNACVGGTGITCELLNGTCASNGFTCGEVCGVSCGTCSPGENCHPTLQVCVVS